MATAKKKSKSVPVAKPTAKKNRPSPKVGKTKPAPRPELPSKAARSASIASKPAKTENAAKQKKLKVVRDSFTIPKDEYTGLQALKRRAAASGRPAKKSEILRAGIKALADMADPAFTAALRAVPAVKTGRPSKDGKRPAGP